MKSLDIRSEPAVKLLAEFLDMDSGGRRANAEHFAHGEFTIIIPLPGGIAHLQHLMEENNDLADALYPIHNHMILAKFWLSFEGCLLLE